jgi:tRNA nucleotidyltransferase (CCA-adding enzyme)
MKTYVVGGYPRDILLGLTPKDRDHVVVGATPEEMLARGFKPAGKDFPVFLHPETNEEYALARLERKIAPGTSGFSTDIRNVTLEEDLMRRDLTINAIAMDAQKRIYDPYNGQEDLKNKVFRHVSDAFSEDPLRVLRVARFLARNGSDWTIAPDTLSLMKTVVASDDMDEVTQERVWLEFSKGLSEKHPELMLQCLAAVGLFDREKYSTYRSGKAPNVAGLSEAVFRDESLAVRTVFAFPSLTADINRDVQRIPSDVRDVCYGYSVALQKNIFSYQSFSADERLSTILALDGLRQSARLELIAKAIECVAPGVGESLLGDADLAKGINRVATIGDEKNGLVIKGLIQDAQALAIRENMQAKPRKNLRP